MKDLQYEKFDTSEETRVRPVVTSNPRIQNHIAKRLLRSYAGHWGTLLLWFIVSYEFIPMIFYLGAIMFMVGAFSAYKLPDEAGEIARKTRLTIFGYVVTLMVVRFLIFIIVKTPLEQWESTLQFDLPAAFANSFTGFMSMAFIVGMFMGFLGYMNYILQLFMFHRSDRTSKDKIDTLMRRKGGSSE